MIGHYSDHAFHAEPHSSWPQQDPLAAYTIPDVPVLTYDTHPGHMQPTGALNMLALAAHAPIALVKSEDGVRSSGSGSNSSAPWTPIRTPTLPALHASPSAYQRQAHHVPTPLYALTPLELAVPAAPAVSSPSSPWSHAESLSVLSLPPSPTTTSTSSTGGFSPTALRAPRVPHTEPAPARSPSPLAPGVLTEFWGAPAPSAPADAPPAVHVFRLRPGALEPVTDGADGPLAPWLFDGCEDEDEEEDEECPAAPPSVGTGRRGRARRDRVYQCRECRKWFDRPSALATHMNAHSGAQPFKCPVRGCGRHFSVRSNARRHARTHEADAAGSTTARGGASSPSVSSTPSPASSSPTSSPPLGHAHILTNSGFADAGSPWGTSQTTPPPAYTSTEQWVPTCQWTSLSGALVPCA